MSEPAPHSTDPSRVGCVAALALGLLPAVLAYWLEGSIPAEEWVWLLLLGLFLALPFGYLALEGTKASLPWVVAIGLTGCFWGVLIVDAVVSARNASGVNFGMIPLLFSSPIVVTLAAWAAVRLSKRP